MPRCCVLPLRLLAIVVLAFTPVLTGFGQTDPHAHNETPEHGGQYEQEDTECTVCKERCPLVAIKSNLLYDAALTPDLGIELSLSRRISVGLESVYAWWSNDRTHRYWRIRGGWLDISWWFGAASRRQRLTGHHVGIYASMHDYDFEFGNKGWQARNPTFGTGFTYGYSFRLNGRLCLDLHLRAGYAGGRVTEYIPQCGTYMCVRKFQSSYWGLTGAGVTLVWFPGHDSTNNPSR